MEADMSKHKMWTSFALAVLLAAALSIGCGGATGGTIDDATITTRVKTAILNDSVVGGQKIDVDTSNRVVTLSGQVVAQADRDRAVKIARSVEGVADVKDTLQVVPGKE
jgi:hyperosmotically inducible protein